MALRFRSAPDRIDEGEKGLLAISELEAHMVSIREGGAGSKFVTRRTTCQPFGAVRCSAW